MAHSGTQTSEPVITAHSTQHTQVRRDVIREVQAPQQWALRHPRRLRSGGKGNGQGMIQGA